MDRKSSRDGADRRAGPDSPGIRLNRSGGLCISLDVGESVFLQGVGGYPLQVHLIRQTDGRCTLRFSEVPDAVPTPIVREAIVKRVMDGAKINRATPAGKRNAGLIEQILEFAQD